MISHPSPSLTVDLGCVAENVRRLRETLPDSAGVMAVIKANAYGLGSVDVARAALAGGATHLAVARGEEVRVLRAFEVHAPVLVLGETPTEMLAELAESETVFTVWDRAQLPGLVAAARAARRRVSVHLKIDTGMHRLGVAAEGAVDLAAEISAEPSIQLTGVFTHFASADEPDPAPTLEQWHRFESAVAMLRDHRVTFRHTHASNSAAALRFPQMHGSFVRVGLLLSGISPIPSPNIELLPAVRLQATVVRVAMLPVGEGIGYGMTDASTTLRRVATVAVGYADGLRRAPLSPSSALVHGHRVPRVGRVSMDLTTFDVTAVPSVAVGDTATFIGRDGDEEITVSDVARETGTIPWEVLTSLSPRVRRIPVPLPKPVAPRVAGAQSSATLGNG